MKMRRVVGILSVAALVGVGGCGSASDDGNPDSDGNTGGSSASGGKGGSSASGGSSSASGGSAGASSGGSSASGGSVGTGGSAGAGSGGAAGAASGGSSGAGGAAGSDAGSAGAGGAADGGADATPPAAGPLTFTGDFAMMGNRLCWKEGNTKNTGGKSPELKWTGTPPAGTLSYAVSLVDVDAAPHWVIYNIPVTATGLPAGISAATLPMGAQQSGAWYGPGAGDVHEYEWKLWPLKVASLPTANKGDMVTKNFPANVIGKELTITAFGNQDADCN